MVHPCDKPCGNKTASGYCATTACINSKYCNIGTAQYGQGVQKRIITNADFIRNMTDEELATVIALPYLASPPWCANHTACPYISEDPTPCDKCALEWLKQEAEI